MAGNKYIIAVVGPREVVERWFKETFEYTPCVHKRSDWAQLDSQYGDVRFVGIHSEDQYAGFRFMALIVLPGADPNLVIDCRACVQCNEW